MKIFIFILLYFACNSMAQMKGGLRAENGEFKYVVQVHWEFAKGQKTRSNCGGTIIDKHWVITAQHCVNIGKKFRNVYIVAGQIEEELRNNNRIRADALILHESYEIDDKDKYDIALLYFKKQIPFSEYVNKVQMVDAHKHRRGAKITPPDGKKCVVMGWGCSRFEFEKDSKLKCSEPTGALMYDDVPVVSCRKDGFFVDADHNMCVGEGDNGGQIGSGDSGGPVVCKNDNGVDRLYGVLGEVLTIGDHYSMTNGVRLANQKLNIWIKDKTGKKPILKENQDVIQIIKGNDYKQQDMKFTLILIAIAGMMIAYI